jgi:protein TonB
MRRAAAAIILSFASHILLLLLLPGPDNAAPVEAMRVSLAGMPTGDSGPPEDDPSEELKAESEPESIHEPVPEPIPEPEIKQEDIFTEPRKAELAPEPVTPIEEPVELADAIQIISADSELVHEEIEPISDDETPELEIPPEEPLKKINVAQVKSVDLDLQLKKAEAIIGSLPEVKKEELPKEPPKVETPKQPVKAPEKPARKPETPKPRSTDAAASPKKTESPDAASADLKQPSSTPDSGGPSGPKNGSGSTAGTGSDAVGSESSSSGQGKGEASGSNVGGTGVVDISSLTVTKKIAAEYPMISRKRRDQGTVILLVNIKAGKAASVEVERSSGFAPLDEAAIRAVRSWEFKSSGYGDSVTARIPFLFKLK